MEIWLHLARSHHSSEALDHICYLLHPTSTLAITLGERRLPRTSAYSEQETMRKILNPVFFRKSAEQGVGMESQESNVKLANTIQDQEVLLVFRGTLEC
jgi:hypothetical protein